MYTVNSVWNVQCTTHSVVRGYLQLWPGFPCGFSTKQLQVQIHNPKLCAKQKCLWELERGGLCFAGPWPTSRAPLCCMIAHCCGWIAHTQMKMMLMQSFPLETLQWRAKEIYEVFSHRCKSCNNQISCFWILSIPLHSHGSGWKKRKMSNIGNVVSDVILLVWAGYAAEVSLHASSKWFLRGNLPNVF